MDPAFHLRPGTNDEMIYTSVVARNEYRVPGDLTGALVIDIGMHIGAFGHLALARGAAELHGFEPDAGNFALAAQNLAPFGARAHLRNHAVWRSDLAVPALHFWRSTDRANAGGGTLIWETDGPLVETVRFDDVIDEISDRGRRQIGLLKIDCEGAEFPILLTSKRLACIDRIVGEYHELRAALPQHVRLPGCEQFTMDLLTAHLEATGFAVTLEPQAMATYGALGLFFAERTRFPG
ncbi:MAG TPA: FkbM family methyltransferase [Vicinamibacterales bacterium]|nr:FkbM family methyltransferase [Vicinamibacterales bacterium]